MAGYKRRSPKDAIPPGWCGFSGCGKGRLGGVWKDGGSYMCEEHRDLLLPVRALWDKTSPLAVAYRSRHDTDKELAELRREAREERAA